MADAGRSFFERHALPVFEYLSDASRQAIERRFAAAGTAGLRAFRETQWVEFFKGLDWLTLEQIALMPRSPARKLPVADQMRLFQELKAYYRQKDEARQRRRLQRQTRQRRVIDYFREKIPPADKRLLEQLRDYELALTARDVNWQYYFALRTFRRIDAFLAETPAERLTRIARFKADVLAYKRNLEARRWWGSAAAFDDEVFEAFERFRADSRAGDGDGGSGFGTRPARRDQEAALCGDYALLRLSQGASAQEVKRQFRKLALQAHPDITGDDGSAMRRLLAAYERVRAHCPS